jgi:hypothetical protein
MSTATNSRAGDQGSAPMTARSWALALAALAVLAGALYFIWQHFQTSGIVIETREGRPLLKSNPAEFRDAEVGIRFKPPAKWSMQLVSKEAPEHSSDRMVVKYKRLLPNAPAAWFRVYVVDVPPHEAIADAVQARNPGHDGWKPRSGVESITVAGYAAAKIRYTGSYNGFPSFRDIVGVRRGGQVFFFVSTYRHGDSAAQQEAAQAMHSVLFESQ